MYAMGNEEVEAVRRVINGGQLFRYRGGEGGETDSFEKEWAELIGTKYALATSNGTAALICGLVGMGVGPGDEIIVPGYTFMATALAVTAAGAIPILAEIDESLTLDIKDVERKITPRTKGIIPVYMLGLPCDMDAIMTLAKKHGLFVLEDACQADGGSYKGRRLGSIGNAGGFSFNQFKILVCGEGGALTTDDVKIYQRALVHHDGGTVFRDHAKHLQIPIWAGLNFRINEILSAILRVQITRLETILSAVRREKKIMMEELSGVNDIAFGPIHDPEGDCGTHLALLFETEEEARSALDSMHPSLKAFIPLDTDRHVYSNWEPIINKRGAHHPKLDPFNFAEVPVEYSKDMLPQTLSVLGRTVCLMSSATRPEEDLLAALTATKEAMAKQKIVALPKALG